MRRFFSGIALTAAAALLAMPQAMAQEAPQEWTLVNPTGVIKVAQADPAKRITTLEGKTIALRWNSKHNGNNMLDRIGEQLAKRFPTAKIIKTYETNPDINKISANQKESLRITKVVASVRPDIVIASQAD